MRPLIIVATLMALAGCGADGEPVRPTASSTISVGDSGVYANTRIGLNRGPLTVIFGI